MIIEWHTHVYPPEEAAADTLAWDGKSGPTWAGRCPMTLENVLEAHHRCGIDATVFSNAAHYMRGKAEADELKAIQRWSDYAAEIQAALRRSRLRQGDRARYPSARAQRHPHPFQSQGPLPRR
jgi:hypothetical protein